jgi:hypothetical protein
LWWLLWLKSPSAFATKSALCLLRTAFATETALRLLAAFTAHTVLNVICGVLKSTACSTHTHN